MTCMHCDGGFYGESTINLKYTISFGARKNILYYSVDLRQVWKECLRIPIQLYDAFSECEFGITDPPTSIPLMIFAPKISWEKC